MIWVIYLTELLLYVCFSILMGVFLLHVLPAAQRPVVAVSSKVIKWSIAGVLLFSLAPVFYLILQLQVHLGWALTVQNVLSSFEIGKAWVLTCVLSFFFYWFVSLFPVLEDRQYSALGLMFVLLLIGTIGWAGHSASLNDTMGFVDHFTHLSAVSMWAGVLVVIGWFGKGHTNWLLFLKWFTPFAVVCLFLIGLTGIRMMTLGIEVEHYSDAWILNYGQALLWKHLFILPLLLFAFLNGFWGRKKLKRDPTFNPLPWIKGESALLLLIFTATAVLGQQPPPHEISTALLHNGVSPLFHYIYGESLPAPLPVEFEVSGAGVTFFSAAILFLALALWGFLRKLSVLFVFVASLLIAVSTYLGLMTSIQ